jgi:glycosyltransferase involved in cell wall biosynthesis
MSLPGDVAAERLCILSTSFAGGGAERVAVNLANDFVSRGLSVDLVVLQSHGPYRSHVSPDVQVFDLGGARVRYAIPALRRYFRERRPDRLLSMVRDTNLAAALAAIGLPRAPVMFFREANTFEDLDLMPRWKAGALRVATRALYGRARRMVANSEATKRDILSIGVPGLPVDVIHNPVLARGFDAGPEPEVPHPWMADPATRVLLGAGRLDVQKDFATAIGALARLRATNPEARLVIIGEGAQRPRLEAIVRELGVADAVDLVGFVANPASYFAHADVFVLSSRWEGFGNVIVEALAAGTPVVSTDCPGGPGEILAHGVHGELVAVGDPRAMADAIRKTLEHPRDPGSLRARARDFTADRIGAQYLRTLGMT